MDKKNILIHRFLVLYNKLVRLPLQEVMRQFILFEKGWNLNSEPLSLRLHLQESDIMSEEERTSFLLV